MPGAKLFLVLLNMLGAMDWRWADEEPMSARLFPDEERWKFGWAGRPMPMPGARDMRPPMGRPAIFEFELERFMADAGIGMPVRFVLRPPSV